MTDMFFSAATEAFAERAHESDRAFRADCIKRIKNYYLPSSQLLPDTRKAQVEAVTTEIPRWKNGVKLINKVSRDIFDSLLYLVKKNGGKYNKEANCWVFSNESKRTSFFESLEQRNKYVGIAADTPIKSIIDVDSIRFVGDDILVNLNEGGEIRFSSLDIEETLDKLIYSYAENHS